MIIKNFGEINAFPLRKKALLIAEAGYRAIIIENFVQERIKIKNNLLQIKAGEKMENVELDKFNRIFLIGIGKGSSAASLVLADILKNKLDAGIALDITNSKSKIKNPKLKIFTGTHPLPSRQNVSAVKKIIGLLKNTDKNDLVVAFICGGGSALGTASYRELKNTLIATKELTGAGADIIELNTVRKHLSDFKAGGLAKTAYPATIISLICSDVLGNDLSMVASGPTVMDKTKKKDAEKIIEKYLRKSKHRSALIRALNETPKDKKYFRRVKNILFVSNKEAAEAMKNKADSLGFKSKIYSLTLRGEAKSILWPLVKNTKAGEALIAAGESVVYLKPMAHNPKTKTGKGGRNMEAVLGALYCLNSQKNLCVVSFASDGHDNTEAAGAIGDHLILKKARELKLNRESFLENHDSFNFFKKTKGLIFAEPKSFNVSDLMLVIKKPGG